MEKTSVRQLTKQDYRLVSCEIHYRAMQVFMASCLLHKGKLLVKLSSLLATALIKPEDDKFRFRKVSHDMWRDYAQHIVEHRISLSESMVALVTTGGQYYGTLPKLAKLLRQYATDTNTPDAPRIFELCLWLENRNTLRQVKAELRAISATRHGPVARMALYRRAKPFASPCELVPDVDAVVDAVKKAPRPKHYEQVFVNFKFHSRKNRQVCVVTRGDKRLLPLNKMLTVVSGTPRAPNVEPTLHQGGCGLKTPGPMAGYIMAYAFKDIEVKGDYEVDYMKKTFHLTPKAMARAIRAFLEVTKGEDWDKLNELADWLDSEEFAGQIASIIHQATRPTIEYRCAAHKRMIADAEAKALSLNGLDMICYRGNTFKRPPAVAPWDLPLSNVRPTTTEEAAC